MGWGGRCLWAVVRGVGECGRWFFVLVFVSSACSGGVSWPAVFRGGLSWIWYSVVACI